MGCGGSKKVNALDTFAPNPVVKIESHHAAIGVLPAAQYYHRDPDDVWHAFSADLSADIEAAYQLGTLWRFVSSVSVFYAFGEKRMGFVEATC